MKKFKALLMALVCLTCMAFTLTACGQTPPPETPSIDQYSITFSSEDTVKGTVSAKTSSNTAINSGDKVDKGTQVTFTATANTGYSFDGWYVATTKVSSQVEYSVTINGDTTVVAKFSVNSYALNYSSADTTMGTVSSSLQTATVEYGASVSLTATPVPGYKLDGWYVEDQKVCDTDVYTFTMPASEYSVEARFIKQSYQFSFSAESGKGTAVSSQQLGATIEFGTEITLTATANAGYTFDGWYVDGIKIPNATATYTFTMPANDYALVAKFTTNTYALNYSTQDTDMGSVSSQTQNGSQVEYGAEVVLTATANTGYDFDGWYENNVKVSSLATWTFNMPANARSVEARFTPKQHTLIYTVNNQAYGRVESQVLSNSQVAFNSSVTLTAVPVSEGYQFDGWYVEGDNTPKTQLTYTFNMPNNNVSIEARFSIKSFTLAYSVNDQARGSISCITSTGSQVEYATSITLTATEKTGYDFDGWYVGGNKIPNATATYTFTMPANNYTIQAVFVPETYTLSYSSMDTTMGDVSSETLNNSKVEYGTSVTVTATENTGYVFAGWYKAGQIASSDKVYTFTMSNQDVTLTAKFEKAKYTLNYSSQDQLKGTVSSATTSGSKVEYLASITVTATELTGYDFDGWYIGEDKIPNATATYTFTMPASEYSIEARFVPEKRTVYFNDGNDRIHTVTVDYNTTVSSYEYIKPNYTFQGWFTAQGEAYDFANTKITENITLYAKMVKDKVYYDLQFVEDDGITKVGDVQKVEEGTTFNNIPTTSKTGYNFMGWEYYNTTTEQYETFDASTVVNSDLTVRAVYTAIEYKVRLYLENVKIDQNIFDTLTVKYNEKAIKPQNPEKEGFLFVKWVYFDNQGVEFDFNQKLTGNVDLLAKWQEKPAETFTVNFYDGYTLIEGEIVDGNSLYSHEVQKDGTVSAPADPEKTGYTFVGWKYFNQTEQDFVEYTDSLAITENLKVYAIFEINTYKVVFKDYNGSILKEEQTVNYGSSAIAPTNPDRTGYVFDGWDKAFDVITEDLTVTAKYTIIEFTVQFIVEGLEPVEQTIEYGAEISVPETPSKAGYTFGGWYTTQTFEENTKYVFADNPVTNDLTLYAKFDEIIILEYTVTFKDFDGSEINQQVIVEGNAAIDPGKQEREGYTFVGWDKAFDNVTEDLVVTAMYQINTYKVTFKDYDGSILKSEQLVNYDSSAIAPANPDRTGYDFSGWDKSFDNVKEDLTITAKYTIKKFAVQFIVDGKAPVVQLIEYGKVANYFTATKAGCKFLFWHLDGENTQFDFSTIITSDLTLYAEFETLVGTYTVEFKVYDQEQGYITYGEVQEVSANYGYVIELAPYKDQSGKVYKWCYFDGENYIEFDFSQKINDHLILYAYSEEVK